MLGHLEQGLVGYGGDVGAGRGRLDAVQGVADAGGHHLRLDVGLAEQRGDVADEADAVVSDVVEASDEGADDGGAGLGAEEGLVDGEAEGLVDADALGAEGGDGLDALDGAGNLDPGVGDPVGDVAALVDHALGVGGYDLYGDGAVDQFGNLCDGGAVGLAVADAGTGGQRGVGGDAADDTQAGTVADLADVGGVEKELHCALTPIEIRK